jgi:dUTP pyrophosphatase
MLNLKPVKIKIIKEGHLPVYQHPADACADCYANLEKDVIIEPFNSVKIPLGFALEIPDGWRGMIYPRSGLAAKQKIICATGVIDSNYRGELCCSLFNFSTVPFLVKNKDRICQFAIEPSHRADFTIVDKLDFSDRGSNGFGSTGV